MTDFEITVESIAHESCGVSTIQLHMLQLSFTEKYWTKMDMTCFFWQQAVRIDFLTG